MSTLPASPGAQPLPALSPEVKNILDEPPVWLVRWGSTLLLGAILLLLLSAGFVRYPRTITGQATLGAGTQTVTLAAKPGRRVRVGQAVLISLNAYPSDKFGQLPGHIVRVAPPTAADTSKVTVAVALDQGYQSTHGIKLHVAGLNHGTAQIIVADKRLLSYILSPRF